MRAALPEKATVRAAGAWPRWALAAALAVTLAGCGTVSEKVAGAMGSMPGIGLPSNAPERPAEVRAYPAVHEMPPPRTTAVLTGAEQQQIEKELVAARKEQEEAANPPDPWAPPKPKPAAKPASKKPKVAPVATPNQPPASSSRMIY